MKSFPIRLTHPRSRTSRGGSVRCLVLLFTGTIVSVLHAQNTPPDLPADSQAGPYNPVEYDLDRYQKIRGKSPFEFELAKPPVGETVDPFADYVLAGFAGTASRPTVYLMNVKTQERITVSSAGTPKASHGFSLVSLNRGKHLRSTTAKMEKDGQQKDLAFDSATLSNMTGGAAGGAAGQVRPGQPGQPNMAGRPGAPPMQANRPAVQPFQAPQAFIPNRPAPAAFQPGQPGQPQGFPQAVQFQGQPGAPGAVNPQQQINTLLQTNAPQQQPMINPPGVPQPTSPGGVPGNPQPRRRVVLPTPAP